ncbi:MAG: hypothetical protein V1679_01450 [Candidatus Peregrinibacteria bacterium]
MSSKTKTAETATKKGPELNPAQKAALAERERAKAETGDKLKKQSAKVGLPLTVKKTADPSKGLVAQTPEQRAKLAQQNDKDRKISITQNDALVADRKDQKESYARAKREIIREIRSKRFNLGKNGEAYLAVITETLMGPIHEAYKNWEKQRSLFIGKKDKWKDARALALETGRFKKKMEETVDYVKAYILKMVEASQSGRLSEAVIAKMTYSKVATPQICKEILMSNNKDLKEALRWALKMGTKDKGGERDSAAMKPKAFETLIKVFKKDETYMGSLSTMSWMIVNFMEKSDKEEFMQKIVSGMPSEKAMKFLKKASFMGVYGPEKATELLKSTKKVSKNFKFSPKEEATLNVGYQKNSDFQKRGEVLLRQTIGSRNAAGNKITLRGILFGFLGQIWAGTTILANVVANAFNKDAHILKNPGLAMQRILTNKYVIMAGSYLYGSRLIKGRNPLSLLFEPKGEKEKYRKNKGSSDLERFSHHPQWAKLFKTEDSIKAVSGYVSYVRELKPSNAPTLPDSYLKVHQFKSWLEKSPQYKELVSELDFKEMKDWHLRDIANAFYEFRIPATGTQAQVAFDKAKTWRNTPHKSTKPKPKTTTRK